MDFHIPQYFYTQDQGGKCQVMVEANQESNSERAVKTKDGEDFVSSSGYILGTPFIQAFITVLDFENNRVGFGTKVYNHGAEITE